ncbi:phage tail protein [Selenomonas sp. AB3002]|uniref:phage tail protein n=1 Tax=Selenomonas sp. AB3002 TaxID=1392502 RepID=UPI00068F895A
MSFLSNVAGSYAKGLQRSLNNMAQGVLSQVMGKNYLPLACPCPWVAWEISSSGIQPRGYHLRWPQAHHQSRFGTHEINGQKPLLEYLGPDGEEITFTMRFSTSWGVDPTAQAQQLRELCEKGEAMYLIIGNQTVGANMWVIESVGESLVSVDNMGRVIVSEVDVTLKEYVPLMGGGEGA